MSGLDSEASGTNRIQVRQIDAVVALTGLDLPLRGTHDCQTACNASSCSWLQVLVRVRPPIGQEANEELAVACSPTQEHVQASSSEALRNAPNVRMPSHHV